MTDLDRMTTYNASLSRNHPKATKQVWGGDLQPGDVVVRSWAFTETRTLTIVGGPRSTRDRKTEWEVEDSRS